MFDWIQAVVAQGGYAGITFLMLLENLFPPIPSELIMPVAGLAAGQEGGLDITLVILSGTLGAVLGAYAWYWVGRAFGTGRVKALARRHGRWLTVSPGDIEQAERWFARHGGKAVFLGRLVPAVRTLISVPAGVAAMPQGVFLFWTMLGSGLWTAILTLPGWLFATEAEAMAGILNPISNVVVGLLAAWYVWRVWRWTPHD